jgi:hypothetical protein
MAPIQRTSLINQRFPTPKAVILFFYLTHHTSITFHRRAFIFSPHFHSHSSNVSHPTKHPRMSPIIPTKSFPRLRSLSCTSGCMYHRMRLLPFNSKTSTTGADYAFIVLLRVVIFRFHNLTQASENRTATHPTFHQTPKIYFATSVIGTYSPNLFPVNTHKTRRSVPNPCRTADTIPVPSLPHVAQHGVVNTVNCGTCIFRNTYAVA